MVWFGPDPVTVLFLSQAVQDVDLVSQIQVLLDPVEGCFAQLVLSLVVCIRSRTLLAAVYLSWPRS